MKYREIVEGDVVKGPWKGTSTKQPEKDKPNDQETRDKLIKKYGKPIPLRQVFAGREFNIINDLGFKFVEKPHDWYDIDRQTIDVNDLYQIEKDIGRAFETYHVSNILDEPHPTANADLTQVDDEESFLIETKSKVYLANRSGAETYIRYWMRVVE